MKTLVIIVLVAACLIQDSLSVRTVSNKRRLSQKETNIKTSSAPTAVNTITTVPSYVSERSSSYSSTNAETSPPPSTTATIKRSSTRAQKRAKTAIPYGTTNESFTPTESSSIYTKSYPKTSSSGFKATATTGYIVSNTITYSPQPTTQATPYIKANSTVNDLLETEKFYTTEATTNTSTALPTTATYGTTSPKRRVSKRKNNKIRPTPAGKSWSI